MVPDCVFIDNAPVDGTVKLNHTSGCGVMIHEGAGIPVVDKDAFTVVAVV